MKLWIARDESGDLALYYLKPTLNDLDDLAFYQPQKFGVEYPICNGLFPEVTFENSPMEVELKLINNMKTIQTKKHILKEWCESNMNVHTDWTGSRVETKYTCDTINVFVDKLWNYLEDESDRMDD